MTNFICNIIYVKELNHKKYNMHFPSFSAIFDFSSLIPVLFCFRFLLLVIY